MITSRNDGSLRLGGSTVLISVTLPVTLTRHHPREARRLVVRQ